MNLYVHWQGQKKRARDNNLVKWGPWVVAQIYKASKLAFSAIEIDQEIEIDPSNISFCV